MKNRLKLKNKNKSNCKSETLCNDIMKSLVRIKEAKIYKNKNIVEKNIEQFWTILSKF